MDPEAEPVGSEPDDAERNAPPPAPTPAAAAEVPAPDSSVPPAVSPPPAEANGSFDRRKKSAPLPLSFSCKVSGLAFDFLIWYVACDPLPLTFRLLMNHQEEVGGWGWDQDMQLQEVQVPQAVSLLFPL